MGVVNNDACVCGLVCGGWCVWAVVKGGLACGDGPLVCDFENQAIATVKRGEKRPSETWPEGTVAPCARLRRRPNHRLACSVPTASPSPMLCLHARPRSFPQLFPLHCYCFAPPSTSTGTMKLKRFLLRYYPPGTPLPATYPSLHPTHPFSPPSLSPTRLQLSGPNVFDPEPRIYQPPPRSPSTT